MPISDNIAPITDTLEAVSNLIKKVNEIFVDDGSPKRQIQFEIWNYMDERNLELAGIGVGAGVVAGPRTGKAWTAPSLILPGEMAVVPIESAGFSSQVCFSYGFRLKNDRQKPSGWANMLLYAYNPRVGWNYGGIHTVNGEEYLPEEEWEKAVVNKGLYAGNDLCLVACKGTGPKWASNVSSQPRIQLCYPEGVTVILSSSRETVEGKTDVSRLVTKFEISDKKVQYEKEIRVHVLGVLRG